MTEAEFIDEPELLNPWISIWRKPRATIQWIVDANPYGTNSQRTVLLLAALGGFAQQLNNATAESHGDDGTGIASIFLWAALVGALGGIIGLFVGGFLVHWTGGWLGGKATGTQIRSALAWGQVPGIWGLLLWIPFLALAGEEMFTTETPRLDEAGLLVSSLMFSLGVLGLVIGLWSLVVLSKCVGQVQGFSAWRGLGNLFLPVAVLLIPFLLLLLVFGAIG
jgi:MFS family permease